MSKENLCGCGGLCDSNEPCPMSYNAKFNTTQPAPAPAPGQVWRKDSIDWDVTYAARGVIILAPIREDGVRFSTRKHVDERDWHRWSATATLVSGGEDGE